MSFRSASRRRFVVGSGAGLPRYDPQTFKPIRDSVINATGGGPNTTNLSNYYESYTGPSPQQQQQQQHHHHHQQQHQQQLEGNNTATLSRRDSGVESSYGDKGGNAFCGGYHTTAQLFERSTNGSDGGRRRYSSDDLLPSVGEGNITIAGSRHLSRVIMSGAFDAEPPTTALSGYYDGAGNGYYANSGSGGGETKRQQMDIYTVPSGGNGAARRHYADNYRRTPPPMKCMPLADTKQPSRLNNWETRLARNRALAAHRTAFLVAQLPAALLVAIGTWTVFVHRFIVVPDDSSAETNTTSKQVNSSVNDAQSLRELLPAELRAGVATIVAGAITILDVALCSARHHRFSHRSVHRQCAWRICVALLCLFLSATASVLIAIAIIELQKIDYDHSALFDDCAPLTCFSPAERVAVGGCALALCVATAACCFVSAAFGTAALARIRTDDADFHRIFRAARISSAHYTNPLAIATDCY